MESELAVETLTLAGGGVRETETNGAAQHDSTTDWQYHTAYGGIAVQLYH